MSHLHSKLNPSNLKTVGIYTDWILTKYANGPNLLYSAGLASLGGDLNKTSYHENIISTTCIDSLSSRKKAHGSRQSL